MGSAAKKNEGGLGAISAANYLRTAIETADHSWNDRRFWSGRYAGAQLRNGPPARISGRYQGRAAWPPLAAASIRTPALRRHGSPASARAGHSRMRRGGARTANCRGEGRAGAASATPQDAESGAREGRT